MTGNVFTLEALQAEHGDALLLHYGTTAAPRLIVIDGGPPGVFKATLDPRLAEIRSARGGGSLEVRMLMVSHVDDDHVTGVLDLTKSLRRQKDANQDPSLDILTLWHNSFEDITASLSSRVASVVAAAKYQSGDHQHDGKALAAGILQGRQLRLDAEALALNVNSGFDGLIQFAKSSSKPLNIGQGLRFTVLGPRQSELDALEGKWETEVRKALEKKKTAKRRGGGSEVAELTPAELSAVAADFVDTSVHNLSSIVVLAELDGHRMLLTGDARGDFILDSLRELKLITKSKPLKLDILKMPHHGSSRNMETGFLRDIVADHYVFSANGKYDNPDDDTFAMLFEARPDDRYTLWLTNPVPAALRYLKKHKPAQVKLHVRSDDEMSVKIELGSRIAG